MERLTLIVSNKCNMNCTYCYANGGNYHLRESLMNAQMATSIFDHFLNHFGAIRQVLFFGGEPLLAVPVIEAVCNHAKSLLRKKRIPKMPKFATVTNGTLIEDSDSFVEVAKKYNIAVTVSLDGPEKLNDKSRKMKNGEGSFQKIINGFHRLNKEKIPYSIECTYTPRHLDENWSLGELYSYLRSLDPQNVILVEEMFSSQSKESIEFSAKVLPQWIRLFDKAIKDWEKKGEMHIAGPEKILNAIAFKPKLLAERFCEGGLDSFTVNHEGMVYPCHILNNEKKFCMGYYKEVTKKEELLPRKDDIEDCSSCIIRDYCQTCPAKMYAASGNECFKPVKSQCNINKAVYLLAKKLLSKT
ncbi:MAG: radical SAM protein [Lentisphaerae bacterium]|nr:radical SAM protein [Lentisphaerota bacterium]MCP4101370.1 radical SAM protein [Lentisphaerota bacterium]